MKGALPWLIGAGVVLWFMSQKKALSTTSDGGIWFGPTTPGPAPAPAPAVAPIKAKTGTYMPLSDAQRKALSVGDYRALGMTAASYEQVLGKCGRFVDGRNNECWGLALNIQF